MALRVNGFATRNDKFRQFPTLSEVVTYNSHIFKVSSPSIVTDRFSLSCLEYYTKASGSCNDLICILFGRGWSRFYVRLIIVSMYVCTILNKGICMQLSGRGAADRLVINEITFNIKRENTLLVATGDLHTCSCLHSM